METRHGKSLLADYAQLFRLVRLGLWSAGKGVSRYLAQAGEVPIRDLLRDVWGAIGFWALIVFCLSLSFIVVWLLFLVLQSIFSIFQTSGRGGLGFHDWLIIYSYLVLACGLLMAVDLLVRLPRLANEAEERIALRFELRRALGDGCGIPELVDVKSLLNLRWRGLHATSPKFP
jgi:hypothetical protein